MLNFVFRAVIFSALLFQLTGCGSLFGRGGYFRDRGDDYLIATEIPPMKIPKEMDSGAITELFVIPPITNDYVDPSREFEVPKADAASQLEKAQVKIQKLNDRRWVVINSSPSIVWPLVKEFLATQSLRLSQEDPLNGMMETVWLSLKDEPNTKDRYRIHIEQGLHANSTEIYLLQMTVSSQTPGAGVINWPTESINPEREKWMLDKLAAYLADEHSNTVSLLAQSIGRQPKVGFVQPYQGESYLFLQIDEERALASVGGALAQLPFALEEAYQGQGYFLITFDPVYSLNQAPEKELGFFAKLFGAEKRKEMARKKRLLHYRVDIRSSAKMQVQVKINNQDNIHLASEERDRLLQVIRKQLL